MPLVFIHGVNTRDGEIYRRDVARRDAMIRQHLLDPLARRSGRFADMEIVNPYWGASLGDVRFRAPRSMRRGFVRVARHLRRIGDHPLVGHVRSELDPAARFVGDAYAYLQQRGERHAPGPVVRIVRDALRHAPRRPGEPLIVLTHSMGGNILHDILTTFEPDLHVDGWVSAAGQVGLFDVFRTVVQGRDAQRLHVTHWLNVYDPDDPLAFRAQRYFDNARDVAFESGAGPLRSHTAYFRRPSFYHLVERALGRALIGPAT